MQLYGEILRLSVSSIKMNWIHKRLFHILVLGVQFSSIMSPLNRKGRYEDCQSKINLDKSICFLFYLFRFSR